MVEPQVVFVVGVGRSGTSLVQAILATNSQIAFPPETNFIRRYLATRRLTKLTRRCGVQRVVDELKHDAYFARTGLPADDVVARATAVGEVNDRTVYLAMLEAYAGRLGKPRIGDKDPKSIEYLPFLAAQFPDAEIVHVIRDPRDVLASRKKAEWSRERSAFLHLVSNRAQIAMGRASGPRYFGARYHEIFYERLLANPGFELRKLCAALTLPFEREMFAFQHTAGMIVAPEELSWKKETLGRLLVENHGKWKVQLSSCETLLTERVCAESVRVGGYALSGYETELSWHSRALIALVRIALSLIAEIYVGCRCLQMYRLRRR